MQIKMLIIGRILLLYGFDEETDTCITADMRTAIRYFGEVDYGLDADPYVRISIDGIRNF